MARIVSLATAVPEHRVAQAQVRELCRRVYAGDEDLERRLGVFDRVGVEQRHFAFPLEYYESGKGFQERNSDFIGQALALSERAVKEALGAARIGADKIDHIYLVTTTGLATPGLDVLLAQRMGFRPDVRRTPMFGAGCAGGAAALIRAADHLKGHPKHTALVVSVELCGQVFSTRARSKTDLVGASMFGDGAAAAVLAPETVVKSGARILFTRSLLFPGTAHAMGWHFTDDGMRLVLAKDLSELIENHVKPAVEGFILQCAMSPTRMPHWILQPGGPRVMESYRKAFGISDQTLEPTRRCFREHGNLASASALFTLKAVGEKAKSGDTGVLVALGPGFAAEMIILRW